MRVALELTALEKDATGSARSILGLQKALARDSRVDLVTVAQPANRYRGPGGHLVRTLERECLYLPFGLSRSLRRMRADLLHCPSPISPVRAAVPLVITIYDVMAWDHPEWFLPANVLRQRFVLPRALKRAASVLTPSTYSRDRIVDVLDIDPSRITITPLAVDEHFTPGVPSEASLARLDIDAPYILAVGTFQPRKNLATALRAFERFARDGADHYFVIVGARGWSDSEFLSMCRRSRFAERITVSGRVADSELVELYRGADCLVFPSRYEGFGLPPLESMACGTPVICSNQTSLPEVVGNAALLVAPDDEEGFAEAMAKVANSSQLRHELSTKGLARAGAYTWARCAAITVTAYASALAVNE